MKKFMNAVDTVLTESLDGFVAAHADILMLGDEHKFVRRRTLRPGKVALISGGGSWPEPPPEISATLPGRNVLRRTNLCSSPSARISA